MNRKKLAGGLVLAMLLSLFTPIGMLEEIYGAEAQASEGQAPVFCDPPLESDQKLTSEVSGSGCMILLSNGELWKAAEGSIQFTKKEGIKRIGAYLDHNVYLDINDRLTLETPKGETYKNFSNVKDFGEEYILQKDGTLLYMDSCWNEEKKAVATKTLARNIDFCLELGSGRYYVIDKNGRARMYFYNAVKDRKRFIEIEDNVAEISDFSSGIAGVHYLTKNGVLKFFNRHGSKNKLTIKKNIKSLRGAFVIGRDGKSYEITTGKKALDEEIIACRYAYDRFGGGCAADKQGNLYVYQFDRNDKGGATNLLDIKKVASDFKAFTDYGYCDTAGNLHGIPDCETDETTGRILKVTPSENLNRGLKADGTVYLLDDDGNVDESRKILTHVIGLDQQGQYGTMIMARKDGTIWLYDPDYYYGEERKRIDRPRKLTQELLDELFRFEKTDIGKLQITCPSKVELDRTKAEIKVTVRDGDRVLKEKQDYTISYKNNTSPGTGTAIIRGKREYSGETVIPFTITKPAPPKKVTGIQVKPGRKQMTVKWKDIAKAGGYELLYAKNSKFTKEKKVRRVPCSIYSIGNLKAKTIYYVKVRAYKQCGSSRIYGPYSNIKKVKIK